MQRWSRRKTQFPLIALFFIAFLAVSVFHNERRVMEIDRDPDQFHRQHHKESSFTYIKPNENRSQEFLDRFSKCNFTGEYSGRRIRWGGSGGAVDSGRRRVASEKCDLFSGKWVFDNSSHPLYKESDCPYISDQLACHKRGRTDLRYQYWRWQPHNCNLKW